MVAHASLTGSDLHECKGADAAAVGKTIIASGSGTASFKYANPRGAIYFINTSTPYTLTYPATATKVAPTTTASSLATEFTEATTARLTYIGTDTLDARILGNLSVDQSVGADRDLEFYVYKNGSLVTGSTVIRTTQTGKKVSISIIIDTTLATNDYIEIYTKNNGASGDINVYTFYMTAFCMRG